MERPNQFLVGEPAIQRSNVSKSIQIMDMDNVYILDGSLKVPAGEVSCQRNGCVEVMVLKDVVVDARSYGV